MAYESILANANDIFVDFDGNKAYLTDDKLFVYYAFDEVYPAAYADSNSTDLGAPGADKLVNYVDLDYTGTVTLYIYNEDAVFIGSSPIATLSYPFRSGRGTVRRYVPITSRKPAYKISFRPQSTDATTEIYGMEVDFTPINRRTSG